MQKILIVEDDKKIRKELETYLNKNGFVGQLKSMLSEFYQYGITPQMLKNLLPDAKTPLMKQKLEDFIRRRTEYVLNGNCQYALRQMFDAAAVFYKKKGVKSNGDM